MGTLIAPAFTSRQPFQWICAANTSLNIVAGLPLQNNPVRVAVAPGLVGQVEMMINGTSNYTGDGEFPPFSIKCEWDMISFTDYQRLAALGDYRVTMITHRGLGYYGKFVMDGGPSVDKPRSSDVAKTNGTMYVLAPSDEGGAATVNRVSSPASGIIATGSGGFIPSGVTTYYWLTFSSKWGETPPQAMSIVTTAANSANTISWTWPNTTDFCEFATLYVSSANDPTQALKLYDIINGETPTWVDVVGFNGAPFNIQPPTVNLAYRGKWKGGLWFNETP